MDVSTNATAIESKAKYADFLACIMCDNFAVVDKGIDLCLDINSILKATFALQIENAVISDKLFVGANFASSFGATANFA